MTTCIQCHREFPEAMGAGGGLCSVECYMKHFPTQDVSRCCRHSELHACDETCTGERCRVWDTITPSSTTFPRVEISADDLKATEQPIKLNPFERAILDFMQCVPAGHKVGMFHSRNGLMTWLARPEFEPRWTLKFDGKEWVPI